jgi:hypothetical protein
MTLSIRLNLIFYLTISFLAVTSVDAEKKTVIDNCKVYYVSTIGNVLAAGTSVTPLITISAAAYKEMPGDKILVHAAKC